MALPPLPHCPTLHRASSLHPPSLAHLPSLVRSNRAAKDMQLWMVGSIRSLKCQSISHLRHWPHGPVQQPPRLNHRLVQRQGRTPPALRTMRQISRWLMQQVRNMEEVPMRGNSTRWCCQLVEALLIQPNPHVDDPPGRSIHPNGSAVGRTKSISGSKRISTCTNENAPPAGRHLVSWRDQRLEHTVLENCLPPHANQPPSPRSLPSNPSSPHRWERWTRPVRSRLTTSLPVAEGGSSSWPR
jgi:hypothetical protein